MCKKIANSVLAATVASALLLLTACTLAVQPSTAPLINAPTSPPPPALPNGVASGDVDQTSAVLWTRAAEPGIVTFTVASTLSTHAVVTTTVTDPLLPVTVTVSGLTPGMGYGYQAEMAGGATAAGTLRTPHAPMAQHGLRFGASGDWRGSLTPYVALANAADNDLDFFIALGDTVYADLASPAVPKRQAETLDEFRQKHAEVYATAQGLSPLADLRASTAIFATIDDHEVLNDFAGGALAERDSRFPETSGRINQTALYRHGLQSFREYNPLRFERYGAVSSQSGDDGRMDGRPRLYRYRTFGQDAALFVLDARSFRDLPVRRADRNDPADVARFRADTFRPGRTMLGAQQLADLQRDLLDAEAKGITWKFVAIPQPIQHRGLMSAQDRFEGFAAERTALLRFIDEQQISNVVFVTADIHSTLVNNITYAEGPGMAQKALTVFEVSVGPVAYAPTLGPIFITDGINKGYVTEAERATYYALPIANDMDNELDDRDDFAKEILNRELRATGYDEVGLDGSPIDATLLAGDYAALHTYGWTEFEIDVATQALTVTTYGIPVYDEDDLANALENVLAQDMKIVSQFVVNPQ